MVMASNINTPGDDQEFPGHQLASFELPSRPAVSSTVPVNHMCRQYASGSQSQNQQPLNLPKGSLSQQVTTGGTSNQRHDRTTTFSHENKKKRKSMADGEDDATEGPSNKQMCTSKPSASTEYIEARPHADGTVDPDLNADIDVDEYRDNPNDLGLDDFLLDFLVDVPGWGPDRAAPPAMRTPINGWHVSVPNDGHNIEESGEEPEYGLSDFFDFSRHHAT